MQQITLRQRTAEYSAENPEKRPDYLLLCTRFIRYFLYTNQLLSFASATCCVVRWPTVLPTGVGFLGISRRCLPSLATFLYAVYAMKPACMPLLPLVAGMLLHLPFLQAQTVPFQAADRNRPSLAVLLPGHTLPAGAQALQHAIPASGGATANLNRQIRARNPLSIVLAENTSSAFASGAVSEAWVARNTWSGRSYDVATAVATDSAGNVYVTGYGFNGTTYDFVTAKYDGASGQQLWTNAYSGPGDDVPTSLAVDAAGNVVVTGSSSGENLYDYLTIKYSASGSQLWSARYNGPANQDDLASSVAVDATGNVVVTGTSYHGNTRYDYATVRYSASGQLLWQVQYNGATNGDDLPTDVALDAAGNAYVTGTTYTSTQSDYATLKYDAATGQQQWVALYNAPANSYDLVRGLAVDAAGNVAITGTSDNGREYDYATVKYTSNGQQEWTQRYNGAASGYDEATAVALDAAGNVVVTGYAETVRSNWDCITFKYAASGGQPLWQAQYNGPDGGYDEARDVAVDKAGNVAVTGRSFTGSGQSELATIHYSSVGQQRWASRYHSPGTGDEAPTCLAVDAAGNVTVAGYAPGRSATDTDHAVGKFAAATGQSLWQARYTGFRISFDLNDMAVDAAGNVYMTGVANTVRLLGGPVQTQTAYLTVKYSASGQKQWEVSRPFRPIALTVVRPVLAVDAAGNVYVSGNDFNNYFTVKYSPSGQQLWVTAFESQSISIPTDIAVDAAGYVYVTGSSGLGSGSGYVTAKYNPNDPSGRAFWRSRYDGPANSNNRPTNVALDAAGNVVVSGSSTIGSNSDYVTVKYAGTSGSQLWVAHYTGTTSTSAAEVAALTLDAAGHAYVTGRTTTETNGYDYLTIKYDGTSGQQQWAASYNGAASRHDEASDVSVDATGNVYVTGASYNSEGTRDYATLKYDANGQQQWEVRYNGPANRDDYATALAVDAAGSLYVTGSSTGSGRSTDYTTLKYDASGQQLWEARYNGSGNGADQATHIALTPDGNIYVAGVSIGNGAGFDYVAVNYSQTSTTSRLPLAATSRAALAESGSGRQELVVYPNPAAATATLSFRPVRDGAAQVRVYNQLGQQVASLYEGTVRQGQHYELPLHSQSLPAGLYTCSLLINGQRQTVRVLVSR